MTFGKLMKDFAAVLGVASSAPDAETGAVAYDFDGSEVTFSKDPGADAVVMTAEIGNLPDADENLAEFTRILLEANFMRRGTGGAAVLGVNASEGTCCLRRRDPLASLDGKAYAAIVEEFLDVLETWQQQMDALRVVAGGLEDDEDAEFEGSHMMLNGEWMKG